MNALLQAALDYAERGVAVFPCNSGDKTPLTKQGFKDASREPREIEAWWRQWPDAMIAAPTGPALGAWVLDIDDEAAFESALAAQGIALPATRSASSGKGRHLYFKWDPSDPIRNTQQHPKRGWPFPDLPGAETRGEGGYIILPPSVHPSGRTYQWLRDEDSSEAPDDLLSIIRAGRPTEEKDPLPAEDHGRDTPYGLAALEAECETVRRAGAGEQECALNEAALKMGGLVAGGCLSWTTALGRLIGAGLTMTSHDPKAPWTPQNVTVKVEHSMRDGMRSPRGPQDVVKDAPGPSTDPPRIAATPYVWREASAIPERPWIMGRWLLRRTLTGVIASGGCGKSTFIAAMAQSLVTGRALLGKGIWPGPQRVWIWNLEDELDELARAIQAAALHYEIERQDVVDRLFVDSAMEGAGLCTAVEDGAGFRLLEPVYEALLAELTARKIDVLIIDPFVSSHEIDENANVLIDKIAKRWSRVAVAADCSIVLVHHTSKAGAGEVTVLSSRGAVSLTNVFRQALLFNRMDKDAAERLGVDEDDIWRLFSVEDGKRNRAPAERADWYRLASVDLGNGPANALGGIGGDSVGVAEPWALPDPFANVLPSHLLRVQTVIDEGNWRESAQSPDWAGHAVAGVMGWDAANKAEKARIGHLLRTWLSEGALKLETRKDAKRMDRAFVAVGRWQNDASATPA